MTKEVYIRSIRFIGENSPKKRQLKIKLNTGITITVEAVYEGWEQWGGTQEELWHTVAICDRYNYWLHGGVNPNNE